jgi:hypothetical protein
MDFAYTRWFGQWGGDWFSSGDAGILCPTGSKFG